MTIIEIITLILSIIGGASILLRIIAPLTKTKIDNKILKIFEWILENISIDSQSKIVNIKDKGRTLKIKLKR